MGKPIKYTEDFLRQFSHIKYDVPESVKISDLYIHAPKPTVHRPRVHRSRSKDAAAKNFLSPAERQELQRRRKDDEQKPPAPVAAAGSDAEVDKDTTAAALQDAQEQEQILVLPMRDPDTPGSANKPAARSLLARRTPKDKPRDGEADGPTVETDERRLAQRLKQVEYGKVTHGYKCYLHVCPRDKRRKGDPQTPSAAQKCSKRSWDGQVKKWRRQLHKYDDALPLSATGGTLGDDVPASDADDSAASGTGTPSKTPTKRPTGLSGTPGTPKTPTLSREERDELARKRREDLARRSPKTPAAAAKPAPGDDGVAEKPAPEDDAVVAKPAPEDDAVVAKPALGDEAVVAGAFPAAVAAAAGNDGATK